MGITTTIPTNLNFPNRGVLERDDFVNAQETAQDLLAGAYTIALNQYATELNTTEEDINLKWEQVQSQAITGGYSQAYIDATFTPKILNTQTDKTTPVDADLIPLSDSASSFELKKLSWANIKATLKSYFDTLYLALTGNQSVGGVKTFTSSPIVPTPAAQDNSAKVATTAYVDGKMVLSTAVSTTSGTAIDFTSIPSWAKRITVLFNKVSINNTDKIVLRVGSGSVVTTGYTSTCSSLFSAIDQIGNNIATNTTGFLFDTNDGAFTLSGSVEIFNLNGNLYVSNGCIGSVSGSASPMNLLQTGTITLSGALDRIRLTTVSGTATFDAGSINIMYEG